MNKKADVDVLCETYQEVANRLTATLPTRSVEAKKGARIARRIFWMCRQAGWAPETTLASRREMSAFFDANRPATFGLAPGSYAVYRSEILSVLKPDPVRKGRYILQMRGVYRAVYDVTVDVSLPPRVPVAMYAAALVSLRARDYAA